MDAKCLNFVDNDILADKHKSNQCNIYIVSYTVLVAPGGHLTVLVLATLGGAT